MVHNAMRAFVYSCYDPSIKVVKFGMTTDIRGRMNGLRSNKKPLFSGRLTGKIEFYDSNNAYNFEWYLTHFNCFGLDRYYGREWFKVDKKFCLTHEHLYDDYVDLAVPIKRGRPFSHRLLMQRCIDLKLSGQTPAQIKAKYPKAPSDQTIYRWTKKYVERDADIIEWLGDIDKPEQPEGNKS